ncbi:type II secretion system F family protein [Winogradskyella flava]|uniref:General secretion pathway protein F n=1 Tax=Winogradskyella flava TaxID=1884876 RepID=A0A842IUX6_9FLAO|nr:type II secretion system F family protein [Winogradskyella flava]MBC2844638.1 type II secretion system F family protein [Winogradskyella flava]
MAFQLEHIKSEQVLSKEAKTSTSLLEKEILVLKKAFSNKIKEDFYTELSVLLQAGITLRASIGLIKDSQKNTKTKAILEAIVDDITTGKSLSESIKEKKEFSNYEYYSVKIGEETGTIAKITEQLGAFYNRKNEQRKQLINALTYPCIILTTAVLVVVFMLQFVVPMFEDIFKQQNVELPAITLFVVNISAFIKSKGWLLLVFILLMLLSRPLLNNKTWYKKGKDLLISKIPFVGEFVRTVYLSQFTQAIALLSASKVPVVNSINLVKQMIDYYPLISALENVEQKLLKGDALSKSLSGYKLFDDKMIALVKVSEETNQTEFMFKRLNSQYSSRVQQRSKVLSTVMEPVIIMFVGLFVGFILIAMYLPMFKLSSILG